TAGHSYADGRVEDPDRQDACDDDKPCDDGHGRDGGEDDSENHERGQGGDDVRERDAEQIAHLVVRGRHEDVLESQFDPEDRGVRKAPASDVLRREVYGARYLEWQV